MTFREQIRNLAGSQSYSRGLQIYNRGKVLRFHMEEAEDVYAAENVVIEADVEGSRRTPYHVYLMWNTVWEDLVESECSCPAFWEYDGICKHCVAALLKYLDEKVMDHEHGSWYHQLDRNNQVLNTVWPGKSDLYHATQATLIPFYNAAVSIARAVKDDRRI